MTSAHDALERLQADGSSRPAAGGLAHDKAAIASIVRRRRRARAATAFGVTVVIAFALAVTGSQLAAPGAPITTAAGASAVPGSPRPDVDPTISVYEGEPASQVAGDLAVAFNVTRPVAYEALIHALPPEAYGSPEGWIAVGKYQFGLREDLGLAAWEMVGAQVTYLIGYGVPHDDWRKTVILASIAQQEAPSSSNQAAVVRVLLNRMDAGLPLAVPSVVQYASSGLYTVNYGSMWPETQYDVYSRKGLPPTAIGASTRQAVEAAAKPTTGDWLYFTTDVAGNVRLSRNNQKFAPGPDLFFPSETQND